MTKSGLLLVSLIAAGAVIAPGAAMAGSSADRSFEISGTVPLICNATYQPDVVSRGDGTVELGTVAEFCNSGRGYRVVADYANGSDPGVLFVDGKTVQLASSGESVIAEVGGPAMLSRQLSYHPGSTPLTYLRIKLEASGI